MIDVLGYACGGYLVLSALLAFVIWSACHSNRRMYSDRPRSVGIDTADAADLDGASLPVGGGTVDGARPA